MTSSAPARRFSAELCRWLNADIELLHADRHSGRGIRQTDLSRLLRRYGITSKNVRDDVKNPDGSIEEKIRKGYDIDDLHPAWERYLNATNGATAAAHRKRYRKPQ